MKWTSALTVLLGTLLSAGPGGQAQDPKPPEGPAQTETVRSPIPEAAAQKESEKLVRDVFKADYARRTPADQQALADKLIREAVATK